MKDEVPHRSEGGGKGGDGKGHTWKRCGLVGGRARGNVFPWEEGERAKGGKRGRIWCG